VGLIGPMSKAAADSDSTARKHRQRGLSPWKPGQSGNPKGRPKGARNKLSEDIADLHESWLAFGKPALMTAAWTDPVAYVRVVASLIPRELEATIPTVHMERMSDAQLEALIAQDLQSDLDPAAPDQDAQLIQ
jgi:Family of unknown function (DUF5681)